MKLSRHRSSLLLASLSLGLAITAAPLAGTGFAPFGKDLAFAGKGNGGGGGQGNGGGKGNAGGHGHAGGKSKGAEKSAAAKSKVDKPTTAAVQPQKKEKKVKKEKVKVANETPTASSLGKLNGFLHASPAALKNAAPNSAIGMISKTYAGQLASYLNSPAIDPTTGEPGTPEVSLDQLAETLAAATNKPLTADALTAVHERLAEINPDLSAITDPTNPANQNLVNDLVNKVNTLKIASTQ